MPGVVTLTFDIVVKPPGISEGLIDKNMVAFLQPTPGIGGSTFDWSLSNPNGKPVANGDNLRANATYTTLPADNAQFGLKTAHFACSGVNIPDTNFEVFYTGIEFNHPGGDPTQPNWFFYYKQNAGGGAYGYEPDAARRSNSISAGGDVSIAIAREAYTGDAYYLTATVAGRLKVTGASGENRWYANFIGILAHERFHANQQTNDPAIDADRDNLSDAFETGTSMTDPNDDESATRGTGLFQGVVDHEIYAGGPIEAAGIAGADTTKDWASPGTNNKTH